MVPIGEHVLASSAVTPMRDILAGAPAGLTTKVTGPAG